ncbi:MAG: oxidoreductase [Deltaproteobacteria bacterium HGW-Deltaproteobacteria-13]|jgi:nitroreductase|nr:MAG: oxidoreductase [Deltaproteobacteria bacterium HGW-Deltaproteobacteria-13]
MELSDVIASRRSIRKFSPKDITADAVRLLLDAARLAPSGSNTQPARFIVVQSPAAKEALGRFTPYKFIVKAAVIFVCCADLTAIQTRDARVGELWQEGTFEGVEIDTGDPSIVSPVMDPEALKAYLSMNVAIAVEHIVLKAVDLGLGSCWLGRFDRAKVKDWLGLDENIYPVVLLPVGYPDQSPKARPRLPLDEYILKTL